MKRLLFFAAILSLSLSSIGQTKKVALIETLNGDKTVKVKGIELKMVTGELKKAISNQAGYQAFTRTDIDLLMKELNFQNSGMVSDSQRKKVGEMTGADYICVSTLTKSNTEFYIEAYLVNVESGEISNPATKYGILKDNSYANLYMTCQKLANELVGINDNPEESSYQNLTSNKEWETTPNGLQYRFEKKKESGQLVQEGDILMGELTYKFDTTVLFTNAGHPGRIIQVHQDMFKGDLNEGLLMMHKGDKAVFAVQADSISMFVNQMPPMYKKGAGQKFYYEISLIDIVSLEEQMEEQARFIEDMNNRQEEEPAVLAQYIEDNNITVKPTASGLYIVVKKMGNGPKVETGKIVSINYTGRLLDGTIFDTSREADARESGEYNSNRSYEPLHYRVGDISFIPGWDEGLDGQTEGTILTLIIPSRLAYGDRGAGDVIKPYTPLVFDMEIVSVQ